MVKDPHLTKIKRSPRTARCRGFLLRARTILGAGISRERAQSPERLFVAI